MDNATLAELWDRRHLVWALTARELKGRYRKSILGFAWSVLNPLWQVLILTVVISKILGYGEENYSVKTLCSLLPWTFFNMALLDAAPSVVRFREMVKKIYFPREHLILSVVLANLIHTVLTGVLLLGIIFPARDVTFHTTFLFVPVILAVEIILVAGLALIVATLHTFYYDTQFAIASFFAGFYFLLPILYPLAKVQEGIAERNWPHWTFALYQANPLVTFCDGFRGCLLEARLPDMGFFSIAAGLSVAVFVVGWSVFRRYSWRFPEVI